MKKLAILAAALLATSAIAQDKKAPAAPKAAETKTVSARTADVAAEGQVTKITATVEAIDQKTREVTLKGPNGTRYLHRRPRGEEPRPGEEGRRDRDRVRPGPRHGAQEVLEDRRVAHDPRRREGGRSRPEARRHRRPPGRLRRQDRRHRHEDEHGHPERRRAHGRDQGEGPGRPREVQGRRFHRRRPTSRPWPSACRRPRPSRLPPRPPRSKQRLAVSDTAKS